MAVAGLRDLSRAGETGSLAVGDLALDAVSVPALGRLAVDGSLGHDARVAGLRRRDDFGDFCEDLLLIAR